MYVNFFLFRFSRTSFQRQPTLQQTQTTYAMVSRKRSKGQARRAKAIEKERANKMREYLKVMNGPRETPQLVPSLHEHVIFWSNCSCRHGLALSTDLRIEEEIVTKFTNEFTTVLEDYSDTPLAWTSIVQLAYLKSYGHYLAATGQQTDLSRIVPFLLASGTQHLLDERTNSARDCAFIALAHKEYNEVYVKKTRTFVNSTKLIELYLADDHTLVSFFRKHIGTGCSCLYEKYKKVRSIPKMGICFNPYCSQRLLERQKTKCCSRCRVETYCSRECQLKHWEDRHKTTCDRRESKKSRAQN